MFQPKKQKLHRLPADPEQAAAFTLADLSAPDGSYPPDRVHTDYEMRMAQAGIVFDENGFNEQGFLLRRLTSRSLILETAWHQTMRQLADTHLTPQQTGTLIRAASRLQEDMDKTLALILKVRTAQGEGAYPFLTGSEQAVADDPRAEALTLKDGILTIPQVVQAELLGEAIADAEACTLPTLNETKTENAH
ncbi:hypothetical protein [Pusillimonas sp. ANT_WB101]|uniref:hypothetical protein n=1 Tax=Pusillimonas sp. ANT_WB101 TaxID=2597356 RepID=UPI0011F01AC2|nr:hypothetical protein [Pusillimonas sp. ANT_WB101]KAA0911467.1 hypothetical protein FQ179_06475 [Pusillimonas sp. ANT_WB101]